MTKIYTFYTNTHKKLLHEYFVSSVPDSFDLIIREFPQECQSGSFHADGWMKTMNRKVDYVIESIQDTMGSWFIHADCDIQFFGDFHDDILSHLENHDVVAMDDNMMCAGFFACRSNERTLELWENVKDVLEGHTNDQFAFNHQLKEMGISHKKLPRFTYFNYTHITRKDDVWIPEKDLHITRSQLDQMLVHHANYTIGIDNKLKMMEMIRNGKATNHNETHDIPF